MSSPSVSALLARAAALLDRGHGAAAAQLVSPATRSSFPREDDLAVRSVLAEAWPLQDDLDQAATAGAHA